MKKFKSYLTAVKSTKGKKGPFKIEQIVRDKQGRYKVTKVK